MKRPLIILLIVLSFTTLLKAQENDTFRFGRFDLSSKTDSWEKEFTIEPAYTFISGLKFNFDIPLSSNGHYLIAQPIIFYNDNKNELFESDYYQTMRGLGLNIGHRIYLQPEKFLNSIYFQYNVLAHRFKTNHDEMSPVEFVQGGVTYSRFEQSKFSKTFNKTGFDILFGNQFFYDNLLVFDMFIGVGFRYTFDNKFNQFSDFSSTSVSLGYSGVLLNGGIRLGILF